MKKYRLIKEYPGSPELGTIVEPRKGTNMYFYNHLQICYPEDYPEFWEEVVEKDYEILEIDGYSGRYFLNPKTGYMDYGGNGNGIYNAEYYLNSSYPHHIVSVRRLSDGEVFTVGDKVTNPNCKSQTFIINRFYLDYKNEYMLVGSENISINKIEHAKKQLLFMSEEGIDIYEGDECYLVFSTSPTPAKTTARKELLPIQSYQKLFSTKESAEEYLLMNRPCLSIKEIAPVIAIPISFGRYVYPEDLLGRLKALVKLKL